MQTLWLKSGCAPANRDAIAEGIGVALSRNRSAFPVKPVEGWEKRAP